MNSATKNLENDHVNILRLIDVMEKMVQSKSNKIEYFEKVVGLIKGYADSFHHAKEEVLLFPLMVTKGYSTEHGPIAVMLNDHVQGRNFVQGISGAIDLCKNGNEGAIVKVYENMKGYIELLRNHIAKENNVLFRMADKVLTENDHQVLLTEFAKIENSNFCGGQVKDCIIAIEGLEEKFAN